MLFFVTQCKQNKDLIVQKRRREYRGRLIPGTSADLELLLYPCFAFRLAVSVRNLSGDLNIVDLQVVNKNKFS